MNVRVRFAPSPTGELHIGSARTALFNFLFAWHHGGTFILRIEDTDAERSKPEYVQNILESFQWLGINWDEGPEAGGDFGPYFQGERLLLYRKHAEELLEKGQAFLCYCAPEELERKRKEAQAEKRKPRYDGTCRTLSSQQEKIFIEQGRSRVFRLKQDESRAVVFTDLLRGEIRFPADEIDDFVLMKSDGTPAYNFACAVDDALMNITHVIRGDDHISNTPKQVLVYQALGLPLPQFAHIPQILGPDKARLSKRHGAQGVLEYKKQGYLPDALVNFIARLGWSYDDKQEVFSRQELAEKFSLEDISLSPAVFDVNKLEWLNTVYLKNLPDLDLANKISPLMRENGLSPDMETLVKAIPLIRERIKKLSDAPPLLDFLFKEAPVSEKEKQKYFPTDNAANKHLMEKALNVLLDVSDFSASSLDGVLRALAQEQKVSAKDLLQPLRVVLTGKSVSPPLFESMALMGKEKVVYRLKNFISALIS